MSPLVGVLNWNAALLRKDSGSYLKKSAKAA
jgi:hypothetical protein